ncbi:30S ribosomal protein S17 [Coemansia spiralis]|nr:30S ribosomal protein S17 [Coemansia spiralis]
MRHNFIGMVISTAMDKTVRVRVPKRIMNHHVQKEVLLHKNYMAHDEFEKCKLGDIVRIEHCRKLSRHKSFAVAEIVKPARTWTDPDTGIVHL